MQSVTDAPAIVHSPAIVGGPALLWEGNEYRVIETRECAKPDADEWHESYFDGEPFDRCTQSDHPKRHRVLVERCIRTDPFGVKQWAECDGLPATAVRDMLRALTAGLS